jgi:hypothetical protein
MIVQQLIQLTPIALVWLSGLILAITRWQRHPQVSLWIVVSLAAMIVANAGQLALLMALQGANSWTLYLVRAWNPLLSTLGWAGIFVAIFGWRGLKAAESSTRWLQFSIRNLLLLMLFAGIVCGLLRGLIVLMGDDAQNLLGFVVIIPLLFALPIGTYLAWLRRRQYPGVSQCVIAAIGLEVAGWLILDLLVAFWAKASSVFSLLPFLSLLRPVMSVTKWILLLCAALGWRHELVERPSLGRFTADESPAKLS